MPPDARAGAVRRATASGDRRTPKPKEAAETVRARQAGRNEAIRADLVLALHRALAREERLEQHIAEVEGAFRRFDTKYPVGKGYAKLRALARDTLDTLQLETDTSDEDGDEEAAPSTTAAGPPTATAPTAPLNTRDAEDLRAITLAARLFLMPEDLAHMATALPRLTRHPAAVLPCCMVKYPEARDALITHANRQRTYGSTELAAGVAAALTVHHALPQARRAHLHHVLYVHGGQTPGGFYAKLLLHTDTVQATSACAQWGHADIVSAVAAVLASCSIEHQNELVAVLVRRAPPGCGGTKQYNARWLARTLREAMDGEVPAYDGTDWAGPVPTSVSSRWTPSQMAALLLPESAVLRDRPGLLTVACCFGMCVANRMRGEGMAVGELETTVAQRLSAPPGEYATPEWRLFGPRARARKKARA